MIDRQVIDEIVYRNDIEQVIGSYVTLKRAGSNLNGLCPFHSEKTPSFTVFPATKSFYCFGCGAGGDVITFIMKEENLDYRGAVEHLAARAGIAIEDDHRDEDKSAVPRKRIYEMNLAAARFFRECLFDERYGKEGLAYLTQSRGLSLATIKAFGLGFAPNDFGILTRHMRGLGFTEEELVTGFLCGRSQKTGRLYDYYRNRVIFPIIDTTGNVVAFGGRVMDDSKPKYLNTSDTPAFKKSRHLFALNFARKHAEERMILCEGYMDVIALHAAGFPNAVATLGTAITSEQARIFAKYTKQVVICYDSDNAGQAADNKAIRLLGEVGVDVRILKVNGAKDPDEYIKKFGADSFRRLLGDTKGGFEYKIDKILSSYDISMADGKIRASADLCALLADIPTEVERDIYIRRATERMETSADALRSDVERLRAKRRREYKNRESIQAKTSIRNFGDAINPDAAKNPAAASAEEAVIGLLLLYPEHRRAVVDGKIALSSECFFTAFGKRVFEAIMELEKSQDGYSFSLLGEKFEPDEMGRLVRVEQQRSALTNNTLEVLQDAAQVLCEDRQKREERESGDLSAMLARRRAEWQNKTNKN